MPLMMPAPVTSATTQRMRRGATPTLSSAHVTRLRSYNQKHQGQRGFLIGGGSSLKVLQEQGFDFQQLEGEVTVGVNKAYTLFTPTYLVFGDEAFWKAFEKEIVALNSIVFAPLDILHGFSSSHILPLRRGGCRATLPEGLDGTVSFVNNSGVAALRILYLLGCNPIYLLGIDLQTNTQGETHFHDAYIRLKRCTRPQTYTQFYTEFIKTIAALKTHGVQVVSCSPWSLLNTTIPYLSLFDLLERTHSTRDGIDL